MTLHVHRSQRVEALVQALGNVVRRGFPSDPFASLPIVVGSRGMERWLRVELARELGAVMGIAFPFPEPAFSGATRVLLEGAPWDEVGSRSKAHTIDPWDGAALTFRVLAALRALGADPDFDAVRRYLEPGAWQGPVSAREITFATEVADVIDRLMHHRAEDAVSWEQHPEAAPEAYRWIAKVLAALETQRPERSPARLHLALREATRSLGASAHAPSLHDQVPRTQGVICVFGLSTLGAGERERIELLAQTFEIHLFVLTPSSAWWADFRSKAGLRRRAAPASADQISALAEVTRQNALLTGLGEPSQWVQEWLESIDYIDAAIDPPPHTGGSCLRRLQAWVDDAGEMPPRGEALVIPDESLTFHTAHGALRQCEVLRDQLLAAFEADPTLEPSDVLVMTPDVATYAPLVAAVFSRRGTDGAEVPAIAVSIADRGLRDTNPAAEVLLHTLTLARERVTASALLGFIGLAPVRERFRIGDEDLVDLRELIVRSGLRWAWDEDDRERHGQPRLAQNTVQFALERLAMGVLMPEPGPLDVIRGVVPVAVHTRDRVARFGKLAAICRALDHTRATLCEAATTTQWQARLAAVLERFTPLGPARIEVAERLVTTLPETTDDLVLEREAVLRLIEAGFEGRARGDRPVTGAVTVCALEPMRSVPFRIIALVGMDDGVFPRASKVRSWDPFITRRKGELDRRAIDRHLILEALLSARDRLLILWTGFEPRRGQAQPASVVIEELIDMVARLTGHTRKALVTTHPLQPWSPLSFVGAHPSYDAAMARAASALVGPRDVAMLWDDTAALEDEAPGEIGAEALARALVEPQRHLLKERLGIELDPREIEVLDREPIELDALDVWRVRDPVVRQLTAADTDTGLDAVEARSVERLAGEGLLPLAHAGRKVVHDTVQEAKALRELWLSATGTREPGVLVSVAIDDCVVTGRAPRWLREGEEVWLEWTLGSKLSAKHKLIAWIEMLVAKVVHSEVAGARVVAWRTIPKSGDPPVESLRLVAPDVEVCREHLRVLVEVWRAARKRRIALFPKLSPELGKGKWAADEIDKKGQAHWIADQEDRWVLALWGERELTDLVQRYGETLVTLANQVWRPVHDAVKKDADKPAAAPKARTKKGAS